MKMANSGNFVRTPQKWYLLKREISASVFVNQTGSTLENLMAGELLVTNKYQPESKTDYIYVDTIDSPHQEIRCDKSHLTELTEEDAKWLRPIQNKAARWKLVFGSNTVVWAKRNLLEKNIGIEFYVVDTKLHGQFQRIRDNEERGGYLIYVKLDRREIRTAEWITLADICSIDEFNPSNNEDSEHSQHAINQISTKEQLRNKKPDYSSNDTTDQEKVKLTQRCLQLNWRYLIKSSTTLELLPALKDNQLLSEEKTLQIKSQVEQKGKARLLILHLLDLPPATFGHIEPLLTVTCPSIQRLCEGLSRKKEPVPFRAQMYQTASWNNLWTNKILLERSEDLERLIDILFEKEVLSIDDMTKICLTSDKLIKVNHIISRLEGTNDGNWAIVTEFIRTEIPDLYERVVNVGVVDEPRTENPKETPDRPPRTIPKNEQRGTFTNSFEARNVMDQSHGIVTSPGQSAAVKQPAEGSKPPLPKSFPGDHVINGYTVGSMVTVKHHGTKTGVIKWIGYIDDKSKTIAGLEMDDDTPGDDMDRTSGKLNGVQLFSCSPGKGLFIQLNKCEPDRRFNNIQTEGKSGNGIEDIPNITELIPVPRMYTGRTMGIKGHRNPSYLDASLFCMFAFNDSLDFILEPKPKDPEQRSVLQNLIEDIINPLREMKIVRSEKIKNLLLDKTKCLLGQEKDPAEFILFLLKSALKADPFLELSNDQNTYLLSITAIRDLLHVPSTQRLLNASCRENQIMLKRVPKCLILQLPRSEKEHKMYEKVYPSPILTFEELLPNASQKCLFCNQVAKQACIVCANNLIVKEQTIAAFCNSCCEKRHSHETRQSHKRYDLKPTSDMDSPMKMELFAVLCSHNVAFVKSGEVWLFFDSMSEGKNVPEVRECRDLSYWLTDDGYNKLVVQAELDKDLQRFFENPYICFYRPARNDDRMDCA